MLHPTSEPRRAFVTSQLTEVIPTVASTDYLRAVPDQIRQWVPGPYRSLGTDGYGRSDRRAALRSFFEVDRHYVTVAALREIDPALAQQAIEKYGIDPEAPIPTSV
jgi:pyruvate dehydrogenase E1 component